MQSRIAIDFSRQAMQQSECMTSGEKDLPAIPADPGFRAGAEVWRERLSETCTCRGWCE